MKFANFVYFCIVHRKLMPISRKKCQFFMHNTKIQNLQTSQGSIFHILQHFTTKLFNFTKFKMSFNAVVMNFTIKIFQDFVHYSISLLR